MRRPAGPRRSLAGVYVLCWGLGLLGYALNLPPTTISTLRFATYGAVSLATRDALLGYGTLALVTGLVTSLVPPTARLQRLHLGLHSLGVVVSILLWASIGRRLEVLGVLTQTVRLATPIALGACAGILCERSGVVNIGIEGMMLTAACVGFVAAVYTQSTWLGVVAGMGAGGLLGLWHAVLSLYGRVDPLISGTVINLCAVGGTGFIRRTLLLHHPYSTPAVLPAWPVPWVSEVPVLGLLLFRHQPLVYTTVLLVIVLHVLLFHTVWGLRTRAVGEHPDAAATVGVSVATIRYVNVVAGGVVAGLGGVWFSLETVGAFDDMMTDGKGFIALAAMIFGQWQPVGAWAGALLFGLTDALQIKLQIAGVAIPHQWLGMTPYVVTMLVLAGWRSRGAASSMDRGTHAKDMS